MSDVKFVQIAYSTSVTESYSESEPYALDSEGRVWERGNKRWNLLDNPSVPKS